MTRYNGFSANQGLRGSVSNKAEKKMQKEGQLIGMISLHS